MITQVTVKTNKKQEDPQSVQIEIKKQEEWLYSRVVNKAMRNGRMDVEVVVMDTSEEIVALGTQVGLVLRASRTVGKRQKKKKQEPPEIAGQRQRHQRRHGDTDGIGSKGGTTASRPHSSGAQNTRSASRRSEIVWHKDCKDKE